jgi:hypothetical protein
LKLRGSWATSAPSPAHLEIFISAAFVKRYLHTFKVIAVESDVKSFSLLLFLTLFVEEDKDLGVRAEALLRDLGGGLSWATAKTTEYYGVFLVVFTGS